MTTHIISNDSFDVTQAGIIINRGSKNPVFISFKAGVIKISYEFYHNKKGKLCIYFNGQTVFEDINQCVENEEVYRDFRNDVCEHFKMM